MLREMYLRAYAQALQSNPERHKEAVASDAKFRVSITLTAPLIAIAIVAAAVINRITPGTVSRDSPSSIIFVLAILGMYFAVRHFLRVKVQSLVIPVDVVHVYTTPRQRLLFLIETAVAMSCIVVAGVVVSVIRSSK
jgi:hypothetical protein